MGGRIARVVTLFDKDGGGVGYLEDGPFHQFLRKVIGPLQEHLNHHGLPPVTIETVARIAAERFA
jgi:hypothetical protein